MAKKSCKNDVPTFSRQGDVGFLKVEALPDGLVEQTSPVLVEGEVTGHAHRVDTVHSVRRIRPTWRPYYRESPVQPGTPPRVHVLAGAEGRLYLHVVAMIQIIHEEHHRIVLDPGYYRIVRQREYHPEAIRTVID